MAKPKIRHLAILARNPKKMADYYTKVFDMEIIHKNPQGTAFFLSDGYITMAVLPHKLESDGMTATKLRPERRALICT